MHYWNPMPRPMSTDLIAPPNLVQRSAIACKFAEDQRLRAQRRFSRHCKTSGGRGIGPAEQVLSRMTRLFPCSCNSWGVKAAALQRSARLRIEGPGVKNHASVRGSFAERVSERLLLLGTSQNRNRRLVWSIDEKTCLNQLSPVEEFANVKASLSKSDYLFGGKEAARQYQSASPICGVPWQAKPRLQCGCMR
jgi:hypothetical protein